MIVAIVLIILTIILIIVLLVTVIIYAEKDNGEEWIYLPFYKKLRSLGENPPEYTRILTDKLRVKEVVVNRCVDLEIAKVVWSSDRYNIPNLENILEKNKKYIMKVNNASSRNIMLNINSSRAMLENKAREWLAKPYPTSRTTEKFYATIKPQVFIEEAIDLDYELRIFCFHGIPYYIRYKKDNCISYYNNRGQKLNLTQYYSRSCNVNNLNLDKAIDIAQQLSQNIAFVCVDLMINKKKDIYFGEYTFCPNNSARMFVPDKYQYEFSNLWKFQD